jgi:hypothetical protein
MKKKILIIGLGKMGQAHLFSFLNDNNYYDIDIYDKKKNLNFTSTLKKKIRFLKTMPKKNNYSFAILSTGPEVRYKLISNLLKNNKVKIILLEKFLFKNKKEFEKFNKIKKKNSKIFVNLWAKIIIKRLGLKKLKNKKFDIEVKLKENNLLTNVVHFYYLVKLLNPGKKIKVDYKNAYLVKEKNFENYDELNGKIEILSKNIKCSIVSQKKDVFKLGVKYSKMKINYSLQNGYLNYQLNNKRKKIQFPLAKYFTSKFFNDYFDKKLSYLPNYNEVAFISKKILIDAENYFNKKLIIR